jgi:hypothetical protein
MSKKQVDSPVFELGAPIIEFYGPTLAEAVAKRVQRTSAPSSVGIVCCRKRYAVKA